MRLIPTTRGATAAALTLALSAFAAPAMMTPCDGRAAEAAPPDKLPQETPKAGGIAPPPAAAKASADAERASGVILKSELVGKPSPAAGAAFMRLTINTNALWRDWARGQARKIDPGVKKDVAEGASDVATKGEPADPNSVVTVEVLTSTKVETRFRLPDYEADKGETTPAAAVAKETGEGGRQTPPTPATAVTFKADDLKPGLFVEVDYRRADGHNAAKTVSVIRPQAEVPATDDVRPSAAGRQSDPAKSK